MTTTNLNELPRDSFTTKTADKKPDKTNKNLHFAHTNWDLQSRTGLTLVLQITTQSRDMLFQLTAKLHQILPSPTLVVSATSVASASRDATRCSGGGSPRPTKPPATAATAVGWWNYGTSYQLHLACFATKWHFFVWSCTTCTVHVICIWYNMSVYVTYFTYPIHLMFIPFKCDWLHIKWY